MTTTKEFLEDFTRDIIAHPEARPILIAGYAKLLELREEVAKMALFNHYVADQNLHELCWVEDGPLRTACDRKEGHKGVHSWDEAI